VYAVLAASSAPDPSAALLALAGTLVLAFAGIAVYASGSSRRAALTERGIVLERDPVPTRVARAVDRWFRRTRAGRALEDRLAVGGVAWGPSEFVLGCYAAFLLTWLLVSLILPGTLAVVCAFMAVAGCFIWLDRRREQRALAFVNQLPDVARMLANGSSAGLSLPLAVEMAAAELDAPAGDELGRVANEMRIGRSLDEALEALQRRLPSREVAVLMTTLVIQQRAGGDVVRALGDLGDALQARKETLREVRTILSGSIFSSWLVGVMAFGTLLLMNSISPGVFEKLTHKPLGVLAMVVAAFMYITGFLLIRRTTRIDV
jgi:tight adherence protein B